MPHPSTRGLSEATTWLFIAAVNDHVMRCDTAKFPEQHPVRRDQCCPNCCGTCNALRWFRDKGDARLANRLNKFGGSLHDWQMADGSVDWPQIEAHWDDTGVSCIRDDCFDVTEERLAELRERATELREEP